jgi:hypothetical protein
MLQKNQDIYPRWMKLKEAAWYSKIGMKRLVQLAQDGHIKGFQDPDSGRGDWVFCRYSLDEYRENQAGHLHQKALEIMQGDLL